MFYLCKDKQIISMESIERKVARYLLEIEAVQLSAEKPFTWASGWRSPIYCDNRKILSYPQARKQVYESLTADIVNHYENVDVIAGVATGAIAWGVLIAEMVGKPFVYVRPKPKDHGTGARIEGYLPDKANVVVVEDLISTGASSLSAVECLHVEGANVLGMVAIFSYNFIKSIRAFESSNIELRTLTNYDTLIEEAVASDYISQNDLETLRDWRFRPDVWGK